MSASRKGGTAADSNDLARSGNKGEILFREGETSADLFIVEEGEIELLKKIDGKHRRLSLIEAGDFFGERELLDPSNRDASARAVTDFKVLQVTPEIFEQMIRDQPDIAIYMLRKLSRELRQKLEKKAAAMTEEERAAPKKEKEESSSKGSAAKHTKQPDPEAGKSRSESTGPSKQKAKLKEAARPGKKTGKTTTKAKPDKSDKAKASRSGGVKAKSKPAGKKTSSDEDFTPLVPLEDEKPSRSPRTGKRRLELEDSGKGYAIVAKGETTIGRIDRSTGKSPDIDFTDVDESKTLSRSHARIFEKDGNYFVEERKGAHNGTFVNGKRLNGGATHKLKHLDKLQFGHVKTIYKA